MSDSVADVLTAEQYAYARELAYHVAHGAWATDARVVERSRRYLSTDAFDGERELLTDLLRLAIRDPDHEWEAPILTGKSTDFARNALAQLIQA